MTHRSPAPDSAADHGSASPSRSSHLSRRSALGLGAATLGTAAILGSGTVGASGPSAAAAGSTSPAPAAPPASAALPTVPAVQEFTPADGAFTWGGRIVHAAGDEELARVAETFADDLEDLLGARPKVQEGTEPGDGGVLLAAGDQGHGPESHSLEIGAGITLTGTTERGVFLGTRTLLQLLAQDDKIPAGTVLDWPEKEVRSLLMDNTPRHFSLEWWESFVRHMSYVKLNDTNLYVDGIGLDVEEMRRIDDIAARYHVTVVPQLNMPAHMNQILPAHPEHQLVNTDGTKNPLALDLTSSEAIAWALGRLEEHLDIFRSGEWHLGSDEFPGWPGTGENHPQLDEHAKERFGEEATFADLFADFQNQANALVKRHGKTMRVWNDMIRESAVVQLDTDVTVEYWIQHDQLPGLLSPQQIADRGNPLINAHVDYLYYDQSRRNLDPREMYEDFTPELFPYRNEVDPVAVRGARAAVWLAYIQTPFESDAEVLANVVPSMHALAQLTWGSPRIAADYAALREVIDAVGRAPGTAWLGTGDVTPEPALLRTEDGPLLAASRTSDGALLLSRQSRPGTTHWSTKSLDADLRGDPQLALLGDGRARAAARATRGLVLAAESEPGSGEFAHELHPMPLDGDPALASGTVLVLSRGGLREVDPETGDSAQILRGVREGLAAVSEQRAEGTAVVAVATGSSGTTAARGADGEWTTFATGRTLEHPQLASATVDDATTTVLVGVEDGVLLAGDVGEDSVTWREIASGVVGRPSLTVSEKGLFGVAARLEDGPLMLSTRQAGEDWSDGDSGYTDASGDPRLLVAEDPEGGDPLVRALVLSGRETLHLVQPGTDGAEIVESTAGRPALALDSHGWPTYVIATDYEDLQTGTQWGKNPGDWGRDFVVGTMSTPTDHLLPSAFETELFADDFGTDTSGDYTLLEVDPGVPAPAPEVGGGRLAVSADGDFATLLRSPAALPAGVATVVATVEALPEAPDGLLRLGVAKDEADYALMWVSAAGRVGFEIRTNGELTDVIPDAGTVVEPGDRIAATLTGTWIAAWAEWDGVWHRAHTQALWLAEDMTEQDVRATYRAAVGLRGSGGEVAISSLALQGR